MTTNVEIKHLSTKQVFYQQSQSLVLNCLPIKENKKKKKMLRAFQLSIAPLVGSYCKQGNTWHRRDSTAPSVSARLRKSPLTVWGKWLEGLASVGLGEPPPSTPHPQGSVGSPLLSAPCLGSMAGASPGAPCSAPQDPTPASQGGSRSTGGAMGMMAAEMPWTSITRCWLGRGCFIPDTGPPSKATRHPVAPVWCRNAPSTH